MSINSHGRKRLFKYYSMDSAIKTLTHGSRRWSTPGTFNDPFDMQFEFNPGVANEEIARNLIQHAFERIMDKDDPLTFVFGKALSDAKRARELLRDVDVSDLLRRQRLSLVPKVLDNLSKANSKIDQFNKQLFDVYRHALVFCLSEVNDSILMWSHYANNHTGAVVQFLVLEEVNSPLLVARPVIYSKNVPAFDFMDIFDFETQRQKIEDGITLVKSDVWAYEHEWRIVMGSNHAKNSYEIYPFSAKEVGAVYLGCNATDHAAADIMNIVRSQYAHASVYKARRRKGEFAIDFDQIA